MPVITLLLYAGGMFLVFTDPQRSQGYVLVLAALILSGMIGVARSRVRRDRTGALLDLQLENLDLRARLTEADVVIRSMERERAADGRPRVGPSRDVTPAEIARARLGFPSGYVPNAEEIRVARKRAIKNAHPDGGAPPALAGKVLQEIDAAAETLKNRL